MSNKRLLIMLIISSLIQLIAVNIFITSLWIHMLYGKAYLAIMAGRTVTTTCNDSNSCYINLHILEKFSRPYMKNICMRRNKYGCRKILVKVLIKLQKILL